MSESLAEYSALQVMAQKYGDDLMHRYLRHELDGYLRGRAGEIRHEPPLALVQREAYVWYQKGGQVLYTLADYIGEDKLNLALHNFLMQYRYANANNQVDANDNPRASDAISEPYPDTRMLVDAIRAQTPPEFQYLVDDGFNRIVLYDNKAISATSQKTADGKYKVTLDVQARKVQADGNGAETSMPLADYIEIGVFSGKKDEEKPLYLKKEKFTEEHKTFVIVVDQLPTRAGIDPVQQAHRPECRRQHDRRHQAMKNRLTSPARIGALMIEAVDKQPKPVPELRRLCSRDGGRRVVGES